MKNWLFLCLLPLSLTLSGVLGLGLGGSALLGGFQEVNFNDPEWLTIENQVRSALARRGLGLLSISKVEQQKLFKVTNYQIHLKGMQHTDQTPCFKVTCMRNRTCITDSYCHLTPSPDTQAGPVHARTKRHLVGGEEEADVKDIQGALEFAVEKKNAESNALYRSVAENVTDITKQVVQGMMYRFTVSFVSTLCLNDASNSGKGLDVCQINPKPTRRHCRVAVWTLPNGTYSMESKLCEQRKKRSLGHRLGGDGHDRCHMYLHQFLEFQRTYSRLYASPEEEEERFWVFCDNMKHIEQLQKSEQGSAIYGINKFADISEAEFRQHYLTPTWRVTKPQPWMRRAGPVKFSNGTVPERFDWRQHGAVTAVKNQGSCGSCWAFSTTGNVEGQWAVKTGKLVSLSEQELVDCDSLDQGCNGGLPSNAYEAIMKLGGLETETDYKYKGDDEKCRFNRSEVAVKINGGLNISSNEDEMKAWLAQNGPISIGINAFAMQFYFGGISHPWKIFCNPDSLDHGVLIVGYDVSSKGEPYWIIKNSWGPDWGEKGYYLVYRGSGVCGLNQMCTSAIIN